MCSKTVSKIRCHTFLKQANIGSLHHVTHTKREIIAVHSNHLFWSKTRLHFGSFLTKVSRVVSTSKSDVSKTPLLTGRGTPLFSKNTKSHCCRGSAFHMVTALHCAQCGFFKSESLHFVCAYFRCEIQETVWSFLWSWICIMCLFKTCASLDNTIALGATLPCRCV